MPTNPAMFDPKTIERFARSMAEGGAIIEELAMKNNINNPNYRLACCSFQLTWLSYSYKLVKMLSVCLNVNKGGTNHNRCTQRLVILHAQTY